MSVCGLCRYKNRSVLSFHYYCWLIDPQTTHEHYKIWQRVICDDVFGPLVMNHTCDVLSCSNIITTTITITVIVIIIIIRLPDVNRET